MATSEGQVTADSDAQQQEEAAETARDAWLEVAAVDVDGALAVLATAARHGRPLPRRDR